MSTATLAAFREGSFRPERPRREYHPSRERPRREDHPSPSHLEALGELDRAHARVGEAQLGFLRGLARAEGHLRPSQEGCRSLAHLLSCRYGLPHRRAELLVGAARALPRLPRLSLALA
ncbi:MAG TPA: hypothetical protein VNP94_01610, partial [Actinomycetota bacterium]|nr:hypothetical protein [Actinomycetota bacterium]